MNKYLNNDRGAALLITLALMALLTGVALMSVNRSTTDAELSFNQVNEDQAFYIAEAGAKHAFYELNEDSTYRAGFQNEPYGGGDYTVVILDSMVDSTLFDTVIIRSTGRQDGGSATIELETVPIIYNPFDYAMFGDSHVEVKSKFCTDSYRSDSGSYATTSIFGEGSLGSNETITLKSKAEIGGDISSALDSGGFDIDPSSIIAGDTASGVPEQELVDVPDDVYNYYQSSNDNLSGINGVYKYSSTDYSFYTKQSVEFTEGTYYFEDFELANGSEIIIPPGDKVKIFVRGDVTIKNSGAINGGGIPYDFQIYSTGDVYLHNGAEFYGTIYTPDGYIDIMNSADVYGSVVGDVLMNRNSACFHYDRKLSEYEWDAYLGYERISWGEAY